MAPTGMLTSREMRRLTDLHTRRYRAIQSMAHPLGIPLRQALRDPKFRQSFQANTSSLELVELVIEIEEEGSE